MDNEREALQIFDLRRIRSELVKLDLDWDAPRFPPANAALPEPLEVEVVGSDMTAKELNDQAWRLVTAPVEQRSLARAFQTDSRRRLKQQPANALFLNTLGVVQYRREQYAEAVAALEKSLASSKGQSDGYPLFFLALSHAKLGTPPTRPGTASTRR